MKYTSDRSLVLEAFELGASQSVTPEGYLYCKGVPIARIGSQQYLNGELEPDAQGGPDGVIHVERRPEDVFHENTIASFEGKPVVDDHPTEMLNPDNVSNHIVGTTINVRRGDVGMTDFLLADLLIYDKDAIAAVRAGKRQVSCGYGSEYETLAPGRARQHTIIGNHVALVARGRCGPSCAIGDADMTQKKDDDAPLKVEGKPKKGFFSRLRAFMDSEGAAFKEGEEGMLTFHDESLPSKSGMEAHSSVGGDTHIHIHTGPNDSTTQAPTTDKAAKDKKTADKKTKDKKSKDDEGTAEEMEESETMDAESDEDGDKKSFMDAMSKAYDAEMKKIRDKKGTKDKKASKDADEDEEDEDTDTKDAKADVEEEGDAESEGSVETADAEEDEDDKDDKSKKTSDKKTKDKKGTKDHATMDSASLQGEHKQLLSDVEILSPGLKLPTFDSAVPMTQTMDSMCLLRRRSLAASNATEEGKEVLTMLNGGKPLDMKKLTCDSASVFFNSAVTFARDRNTDTGRLSKGRVTKDAAKPHAPTSIGDFNKQAADFYANQKPKPSTKSA